jgi:hypothetical protein
MFHCKANTAAHFVVKKGYNSPRFLFTLSNSVLALLIFCSTLTAADQPPGFKLHGRFTGIGLSLATVIGPGPAKGTERLYASHIYNGDTLDIVATDPLTGETDVFSSPVAGEIGAWAMVLGPDGHVYIGTLPTAHIMRVDWKTKKLVDMGRPISNEQYIWQLTVGHDKNIYGCTYPSAKLIRFNPATGKSEDLGRMSKTENYGRFISADNKGFVYVGIGMARDLVAYEIATGQHKSILPQDMKGQGAVYVVQGTDGIVYASAGGKWIRLDGFTATSVAGNSGPITPPLTLADGRHVSYEGRSVSVQNQDGKAVQSTTGYRGKNLGIFLIGLGPDDRLYGSTGMPAHLLWASPDSDQWGEIANAGSGEVYSFLAWRDKLIAAGYGLTTPVMLYKPDQPWKPGPKPEDNPWQISYKGQTTTWRPMAMIAGPQEKVYIGAISGYGLLGGPLCVFDPATGKLDQYSHVVQDHSVVALAVTAEGMIVGGTTTSGGGGSHPTQTEAKIFLWDPLKREKLFETVAVSGNSSVDALGVGKDGLVYGFANKGFMFVFDTRIRKIIYTKPTGIEQVIFNAIGRGADGNLYGLHAGGIFTIDEKEREIKQIATYPPGVTGGFAIRGKRIYFTSGPQIVSYMLP